MTAADVSAGEKARLVREHIAHTTGSEHQYKHVLNLRYTDGMKFVAETCGAYWLLDLIASHQPTLLKRGNAEFQLWILKRTWEHENHWVIECWSDTPGSKGSKRMARQAIAYSDFPGGLSPFEFYVEYGVALLKEEH